VLGAVALALFAVLASGVTGARAPELVIAGSMVVVGAVAASALAVAMGSLATDLADEQGGLTLGPGGVYLFFLVGGLYNLVFALSGWAAVAVALAFAATLVATWRSAVTHLELCFDAEMLARPRVRASDVATLLLLALLGPVAVTRVLRLVGASPLAVALGIGITMAVLASAAVGVAIQRARRRVRVGHVAS
jgi:hypothetical protein